MWLLGKFCLRDAAGSPGQARWLHLARSGSQSQRAIWFILPARGTSHIIKRHIRYGNRSTNRIAGNSFSSEIILKLDRNTEYMFSISFRNHHDEKKENNLLTLIIKM